jgi:hypothetical protein
MLAAQLHEARLEWLDGELRIGLAPGDALAASQLARASNRELLGTLVASVFGAGARWRVVERPHAPAPGAEVEAAGARAAAAAASARATEEAAADPQVQQVLEIFQGKIAGVERRAEGEGEPAAEEPEENE